MHEKNRILFEDIVLCDPITKRGKNALQRVINAINVPAITVSEFYEKIYVEPYFVSFSDETTENTYFDNYTEYEFAFSSLGTSVRNLLDKKERYERRFFSKVSDSLLIIRGSAGAGKSIYLNNLKYRRSKSQELDPSTHRTTIKNLELSFDLESAQNTLMHGRTTFPSNKYNICDNSYADIDSPWHFFSMLLNEIYNVCEKIIDCRDESLYNTINENFSIIFENDYSDEIEVLFEFLLNTNTDNAKRRDWTSSLFEQIIEACFVDASDVKKCIGKALELLTRLLTIQNELNNPYQLLISFDNIEHFINNTRRIYDEDIRTITTAVITFVEDEKALYENRGLDFAKFFKFVLVVRDTTDKMLSANVHDRFNRQDCSIDITGWYQLKDICTNKFEYYPICTSSSIRFLQIIIKESASKKTSSLMNQLTSMYNHNNRRITRILTRIASIFDEIDKEPSHNKNSITFEQFCRLWNYKSEGHIRYLCRQAVTRLIYNEVSNTHFFDRLGCTYENNHDTYYSYARRILTWLHNKQGLNMENYFSFKDLCQDLFFSPQNANKELDKIEIDELERFCKVLIALDEYRFSNDSEVYDPMEETEPNCWCQLIIIKYNSTEVQNGLTVNTLLNKLREQFKKDSNIDDFGIRLTEAGNFFISRIRDYEYFACVSNASNIPLVFINNKTIVETTLDRVYNLAKKTIDTVLSYEYSLFSQQYSIAYSHMMNYKSKTNAGNIETQSFAYRIIEQHKNYLKYYCQYLGEEDLHNEIAIFNRKELNDIIKKVENYIDKYNTLLKNLGESTYRLPTGEKIINYILKK